MRREWREGDGKGRGMGRGMGRGGEREGKGSEEKGKVGRGGEGKVWVDGPPFMDPRYAPVHDALHIYNAI